MDLGSRREKFNAINSLCSVPLMLLGHPVLVDLRNETSVAGRIENADGYMNINLVEVVFIDQRGLQYAFDQFFLPARMIRQIHMPEQFHFKLELDNYMARVTKKNFRKNEPKIKSLKVRRAEIRHQETVAEISNKS